MEILTYIQEDNANGSLDDEVLLHYSENEYKAAVVSNDKFENYLDKWPETIKRRISFKFEKTGTCNLNERFDYTQLNLYFDEKSFDFADPTLNG